MHWCLPAFEVGACSHATGPDELLLRQVFKPHAGSTHDEKPQRGSGA